MANKKFLKEYIVRDGKRYEQSKTIIERFWLENGGCDLHRMRQCGLPCIYEDGYYYYNIDDFIAWHANPDAWPGSETKRNDQAGSITATSQKFGIKRRHCEKK